MADFFSTKNFVFTFGSNRKTKRERERENKEREMLIFSLVQLASRGNEKKKERRKLR